MKQARYGSINGPLVTAQEFFEKASSKYKENGIHPYCPSCAEIVHPYAPHSFEKNRFDHQDIDLDADPLDDCIMADRNPRFRHLKPNGWDFERGIVLRDDFLEADNLKKAYSFCHKMTGKLPTDLFCSMLRRADRKNIWAYAGMELWIFPYLLLTLENFTDLKKGYGFHFVLDKKRGSDLLNSNHYAENIRLKKVFSDSGREISAPENPYRISEEFFTYKAGNTDWVYPNVLRRFLECVA